MRMPRIRNLFAFTKADALPAEKRYDLRAQSALGRILSLERIAQNLAGFLFHAVAVPLGTFLQPRLKGIFYIADQNLRHLNLYCYHDSTTWDIACKSGNRVTELRIGKPQDPAAVNGSVQRLSWVAWPPHPEQFPG